MTCDQSWRNRSKCHLFDDYSLSIKKHDLHSQLLLRNPRSALESENKLSGVVSGEEKVGEYENESAEQSVRAERNDKNHQKAKTDT